MSSSTTANQVKTIFRDGKFDRVKASLLIDALWRDYQKLYTEQKLSATGAESADPKYQYQENTFAEENGVRKPSWATANGFGNTFNGDFSQAHGFFNTLNSLFEMAFGSFGIPRDGNSTEWIPTDRLAALGNGTDANNRSLAFEVFKSGLFEFFNAVKLGKFAHGAETATDGVTEFDPNNDNLFRVYFNEAFHKVLFHDTTIGNCTGGEAGTEPPFNPEFPDSPEKAAKTIQVTAQTLVQANWALVSGLYEYNLGNANITALTFVDVIPDNESAIIVIKAGVLPKTVSSAGGVKLYAKRQPKADIIVTINIFE